VSSDGKWKIADSNGTANNTKTYSPSEILTPKGAYNSKGKSCHRNPGDVVAIYK
jgi:hypothetical protein